MTIGERIKKRRKELGMSQQELAIRMGNKSRASICTVEKDKEDLTTTRIAKFAEALETTPGYLMGWTDSEELDAIPRTPPSDEELEHFMDLYYRYRAAIPEIQDAVERLLKTSRPQSESPDRHPS